MRTNYVLIDLENVPVTALALLSAEHFRVYVFLGPSHTRLPSDLVLAMHELGARGKYVRMAAQGKDALDFHIAYYLGTLATADPEGFFHIISKDTGFDPLIRHLRDKKIFAARSESIAGMPCFQPPAKATSGADVDRADDLAALVQQAVDDLIKRKAAKPRKMATLRSTVLARIGPPNAASLDAVIAALVRDGYVATQGDKVTYQLPG